MNSVVSYLDRRFYPAFRKNWDDGLFREAVLSRLSPDMTILDIGAGAGILPDMNFRGHARRICGVDLDPRVVDNPFLDEGRVGDAATIPYDDNMFDLAFCDNVFEHLERPEIVFAEAARVLKPGGLFLFKTPNRRHYVPLIASLTPLAFHRFVSGLRGRKAEDTFPTHYRANSRQDVTRLARGAGFEVDEVRTVEGRPEYLRIAWPLYLGGLAYERLVNASSLLQDFRVILLGVLRKPERP